MIIIFFFLIDMELYNETIKMANQLPKVYVQQTA
jgi:hypothetical protein